MTVKPMKPKMSIVFGPFWVRWFIFFNEGTHYRSYEKLGAHLITHQGVDGVSFAVWAPNAKRVSVVGNFNGWDGRRHLMRPAGQFGYLGIVCARIKTMGYV